MRTITVKYSGDCRECDTTIPAGEQAVYERGVGIFCPACAPTDAEDVRTYRQEAANRKADKFDEWAEKREQKAAAQLSSYPEIRHDWAFVTQPGHIPFRAKMIKADDRAYESLGKARSFRDKAEGLRKVRVKGDAAARDKAKREAVLEWLKVGLEVDTVLYGCGEVVKINRKTARVRVDRGYEAKVEIYFLRKVG